MQIASERAQALTESRDPETLKLLRAQALGTGDAATVAAIDARLAKLAAPSGRIPDETRIKNLEDAARDADASGDADTANALRGRIKVLTTRASGNTISAEDIKALAAGLGGGTAKVAPAGAPAGNPTAAAATATNPEGGKSNAAPLTVQQASQLPPGTWFMGTDQKWHKRK
jgi:hypothetical protein